MEQLFGGMFNAQQDQPVNTTVEKMELAKEQMKRYNGVKVDINQDPFKWWKLNQQLYPNIAVVARKRLCVAGTSVPSERVFSAAGCLLNAKRSCLSSRNVDMLLFLNHNLK